MFKMFLKCEHCGMYGYSLSLGERVCVPVYAPCFVSSCMELVYWVIWDAVFIWKTGSQTFPPLKLFKGYGKTVGVSKHPFLSDPSSVSNIVFIAFMTARF